MALSFNVVLSIFNSITRKSRPCYVPERVG